MVKRLHEIVSFAAVYQSLLLSWAASHPPAQEQAARLCGSCIALCCLTCTLLSKRYATDELPLMS